jgi:hypothetical protein
MNGAANCRTQDLLSHPTRNNGLLGHQLRNVVECYHPKCPTSIKCVYKLMGSLETSLQNVVVCYDPKYPTLIKCNLNHMHISSWALFPYKSIFINEFYLSFVTLAKN